ncbi:MAG: hypothetical protein K0R25_458 [Rickettsiaceae bacterium]|jgi:hypothetical protein|nr:hypothetical protein [Rickettsiaceae bacterium]
MRPLHNEAKDEEEKASQIQNPNKPHTHHNPSKTDPGKIKEFRNWVGKNISIEAQTYSSMYREEFKLWTDIDEYKKLDKSKLTPLEEKLAGGIILNRIYEYEYSKREWYAAFKKSLPELQEQQFPYRMKELDNLWHQIFEQNFSQTSQEFVQWFKNIDSQNISFDKAQHIDLWQDICEYLHCDGDKKPYLKQIEASLEKYMQEDKHPSGAGLISNAIADGTIVRNVYLNNDKELVALFEKLTPKPPSSLFPETHVPLPIKENEIKSAEEVADFIKRYRGNIRQAEKITTRTQRAFKGRKRKREEKYLISAAPVLPSKEMMTPEQVDEAIADANKPYLPKCNQVLAGRLLAVAKKIKPFSTIRHLASIDAIPNILDGGFRGRKSLLRRYQLFRPAALAGNDRRNGDADAICFGAFEIDDMCIQEHTAEFVLDLDKLYALESERENPCIFFKQRDLGFELNRIRKVTIGEKTIFFTHTKESANSSQCQTTTFFNEKNQMICYSRIPYFQMISSNFKDMNQILAMNFFRFLDNAKGFMGQSGESFTKNIYDELEKLSDADLEEKLLEITRHACDTMELNFYSSFLMNPELIKEINIFHNPDEKTHTFNMTDFIASLKAEDFEKLAEVQEKIPGLFQSYRFVDYLLSKTESRPIMEELLTFRSKIKLPLWREIVEESKEDSRAGAAGRS